MIFRILLTLFLAALPAGAFELPTKSSQCIVGTSEGWNSSEVTLCFYEKVDGAWKAVTAPWKGRLGKNGSVWGKGLHPVPAGVSTKKEGDNRSPAGVFAIGGAWAYDANTARHPSLYFRQVTKRDLWIEDPASPQYNRNVVLDHDPATAWEKKQQMKQDDAAHALKLFIAHNAPPNVTPNAGSSIFFHIWRRGGAAATAGCTTMERSRLESLVSRIDPARKPVYVLLPKEEYTRYRAAWKLP